ncbi:hypothetical protein BN1723_007966 [Verticillium longisporum]|uniref:MYND-type zinc finger protein samB n=1 Tax=Verticillium longisporum TaxID=100787 RepID=A0A0G4NPI7_VERLO|nr:hypothetical protein BN1723_007966 [Verticillium longisporum]
MEHPIDGEEFGPGSAKGAENHPTSAHRKDPGHSLVASSHRRSGSGASLFSKLSFMKPTASDARTRHEGDGERVTSDSSSPRAMGTIVQQQKSRRRTGSLRKVALLGRGAQRERRDAKQLTIDIDHATSRRPEAASPAADLTSEHSALGLRVTDATMLPYSLGEVTTNKTSESHVPKPSLRSPQAPEVELNVASPTRSTNSTTDEDDLPHMSNCSLATSRPESDPSLSSGSDSYFGSRAGEQPLRRRSPLAYSGMASTPVPAADSDWDYSDTEWWGWVETGAFNISHRGPVDGSIANNAAPAPVPPMGLSPNRQTMVTPPQPSLPNASVPRYLLDRHFVPNAQILASMPREEDVLMSLQLLAYVSKYCGLRSYFQKSHLVPKLKMGKQLRYFDGDESVLDSPDEEKMEEEYLLPNDFNIFPLVENFTVRHHSPDMQYWAGVVMRNLCRKDDTRGGIRQCAYYQCGKWEEFTRQFAKCRRCRRTKYCSKECQKSAWAFHRHWCVAASQ